MSKRNDPVGSLKPWRKVVGDKGLDHLFALIPDFPTDGKKGCLVLQIQKNSISDLSSGSSKMKSCISTCPVHMGWGQED